jgi:hypothetical protein
MDVRDEWAGRTGLISPSPSTPGEFRSGADSGDARNGRGDTARPLRRVHRPVREEFPMPYLVAAVVLLGVACLLNMLLTMGILRRMRADAGRPAAAALPFELGPGSPIGEFTAVTTDGEPVDHDALTGLVAFLSADCPSCHDLLPGLVERARRLHRDDVLVVVGGNDPETVRALSPVARVVAAEADGGPVARAFRNTWTPALYLVDARRVLATAARVGDLPDPPGARRPSGHAAGRG